MIRRFCCFLFALQGLVRTDPFRCIGLASQRQARTPPLCGRTLVSLIAAALGVCCRPSLTVTALTASTSGTAGAAAGQREVVGESPSAPSFLPSLPSLRFNMLRVWLSCTGTQPGDSSQNPFAGVGVSVGTNGVNVSWPPFLVISPIPLRVVLTCLVSYCFVLHRCWSGWASHVSRSASRRAPDLSFSSFIRSDFPALLGWTSGSSLDKWSHYTVRFC